MAIIDTSVYKGLDAVLFVLAAIDMILLYFACAILAENYRQKRFKPMEPNSDGEIRMPKRECDKKTSAELLLVIMAICTKIVYLILAFSDL